MVFTIREDNISGDILYQSSSSAEAGGLPAIMFTEKSFIETIMPIWVENSRLNKEGSFTHYNGSNDSNMTVEIILSGSSMNANLAIIKATFDKVLYLDASDVDSNLTGTYTVNINPKITRNVRGLKYITMRMIWKRYNN